MFVNGDEMEYTQGLTVAGLLEKVGINPCLVVVEVDMDIIVRDEFESKKLSSDSKVEIIRMVCGG